jgi:hypothetical protein
MFVVPLLALDSSELAFELVNCHINAFIGIIARLGANENFAVLGFGNYFYARIATLVPVYDHLDPGDAVVILGKLGGLLLGVRSDSFGYFDMFTGDCEKQDHSP